MRRFSLLSFVALTTTFLVFNSGFAQGDIDTIVERSGEAGSVGDTATVDIEMVSLSLVSSEPIQVGSVDSFFDVFVNLSPPAKPAAQAADPNCMTCDEIWDAIMEKLDMLADLGAEADQILNKLDIMDGIMDNLNDDLAAAEAERARMDSGDFVRDETTGEVEDARDQSARRAYRNDTYEQWRAGKISSEEKMERDRHSYELTEDEIDKWAKKAKKDKDKEIKDLKDEIDDLQDDMDDLIDDLMDIFEEMEDCDKKLKELWDALEDCWNICLDGLVDPFDGLGLDPDLLGPPLPLPEPPSHGGLFGWLKDLLFGPPEILPLPPLDPQIPLPGGGSIPYDPFGPIIPLPPAGDPDFDLPPFNPFEVDSFFDVFFEVDVPAVDCPLCDPIRDLIAEKQKAADALKAQLDVMNADLQDVNKKLDDANEDLQDAKDAMDRFNSGDFVRNENTGETETARDQAARNEYRTNTYNRWRNGDITSDQKMAEDRHSYEMSEAELDQWAKKAEKRLKAELANAQKKVNDLTAQRAKIEAAIGDALKKLADCQKEIADLLALLEECEKLCQELEDLNFLLGGITPLPAADDGHEDWITLDSTHYDDYEWEFGDESEIILPDGTTHEFDLGEEDQDVGVNLSVGHTPCDEGTKLTDSGDCVPVEEEKEGKGFFCDWFGIFCPDDGPDLTLGGLIDCAQIGETGDNCGIFDATGDDIVTLDDFNYYDFEVKNSLGVGMALDFSGMDGDPSSLTIDDLQAADDCLNGPGSCNGLELDAGPLFNTPEIFADGFESGDVSAWSMSTGPNRDPVPLDDPPDLFSLDQSDHSIVGDFTLGDPIPPDFFGPGSEPFDPGADGIDLLYFGTTDRTVGLLWPPSEDPIGDATGCGLGGGCPPGIDPLPIPQDQPANCQLVIVEFSMPVKPGMKINVQVTGSVQKIETTVAGNRLTVRVFVLRCGPPEQPKVCPPNTHYESIGTDCSACENGGAGCQVIGTTSAGTNCILCAPPEDDVVSAPPPDDDILVTSPPPQDPCAGVVCDAPDECTEAYCHPDLGDCMYVPIPGCGESEQKCGKGLAEFYPYANLASCDANCDDESGLYHCQSKFLNGAECYACVDRDVTEFGCTGEGEFLTKETAQCSSNEEPYFDDRSRCWKCKPKPQEDPPPQECDSPLVNHASATALELDGFECSAVQVGQLVCYDCREVEEDPSCPSGEFDIKSDCEASCNAPDCDVCADTNGNGCYEPIFVDCGDYEKNSCSSGCDGTCELRGENFGVNCYECVQQLSCEELCSQYGFDQVGIDWSSHVQSYLNGYSCVSGAHVSLERGTVGDCECSNQPSINVDQTVPVCTGTPCGDVQCGGEVTCDTGPNETTTVTCSWGGWRQTDVNQFVPEVGG